MLNLCFSITFHFLRSFGLWALWFGCHLLHWFTSLVNLSHQCLSSLNQWDSIYSLCLDHLTSKVLSGLDHLTSDNLALLVSLGISLAHTLTHTLSIMSSWLMASSNQITSKKRVTQKCERKVCNLFSQKLRNFLEPNRVKPIDKKYRLPNNWKRIRLPNNWKRFKNEFCSMILLSSCTIKFHWLLREGCTSWEFFAD